MLRTVVLKKPTHVLISYEGFDIRERDRVAELEEKGARVGILHMNLYSKDLAKKRDYEICEFPGRKDLRNFVTRQKKRNIRKSVELGILVA